MKHKFTIDDLQFAQYNVSGGQTPAEFVEWERQELLNNTVFLTDYSLPKVFDYKSYGVNVNAFIVESPWNTLFQHNFAYLYHSLFDKIYTHNKKLLRLSNARFIPAGGCWIDPEQRRIHKKTDLVSFVVSSKNHLAGHRIRHEIKRTLENKVAGFGDAYQNYVGAKYLTLNPFMYQIVVENAKEDYYFTEKIIDCFQTGTIPIYWGCPSISKFFNKKGILSFNTIEELKKIMDRISVKDYNKRLDAVKDNFIKSRQYLTAEDYMAVHYLGVKI